MKNGIVTREFQVYDSDGDQYTIKKGENVIVLAKILNSGYSNGIGYVVYHSELGEATSVGSNLVELENDLPTIVG